MKITLKEWCKSEGISAEFDSKGRVNLDDSPELVERAEHAMLDGLSPALCDEGCEVEPDGHCSHGAPSLLLELGVI